MPGNPHGCQTVEITNRAAERGAQQLVILTDDKYMVWTNIFVSLQGRQFAPVHFFLDQGHIYGTGEGPRRAVNHITH